MTRGLFLIFGFVAYLFFFATFLYLIAFVGDLPFVPRSVDRGPLVGTSAAIATDVALIALFGVQHSVMARAGFKRRWERIVPKPIERSVYVVFASLALIVMFVFWKPLPAVVWSVGGVGAVLLWALFAAGWALVLVSTLLISHFELFGLRQVYLNFRGLAAEAPAFRQPMFYKMVRHPLYSGFFLALWAIPEMTAGHLLLAGGLSIYVLIAIQYEERDLVRMFGTDYESYRDRVGMLAPRLRRRR